MSQAPDAMNRSASRRIGWLLATALLIGGETSIAASPDDFLIVPGKRIGPLTLPATETDVMRAFAGHAAPEDIPVGEGDLTRGTALFRCDGPHGADLVYLDAAQGRLVRYIQVGKSTKAADAACQNQKPLPLWPGLQPGDTVSPDMDDWSRREKLDSMSRLSGAELKDLFDGPPDQTSAWHLPSGVHVGMTLQELQDLNGRPFEIAGPEGDAGNLVADWHGGRLANCAWQVKFNGAAARDDIGRTFESDDKRLRGAGTWVSELYVDETGRWFSLPKACLRPRGKAR